MDLCAVPHRSPFHSRLNATDLCCKTNTHGVSRGNIYRPCCLATHHTCHQSAGVLLFHLALIQHPHQGTILSAELRLPSLQDSCVSGIGFLPCKTAWQNHSWWIITEGCLKSAITWVGQGYLIHLTNSMAVCIGPLHNQDSTNSVFAFVEGLKPLFLSDLASIVWI